MHWGGQTLELVRSQTSGSVPERKLAFQLGNNVGPLPWSVALQAR